MAALAQPILPEVLIEEVVKAVPLPKGVRLRRIYYDTDHSGDPSVYIVFAVSKRLGLGPARIRSLGELQRHVTDAVDALHLDQLSYVRFEDAR
jgi:hypothetical protein